MYKCNHCNITIPDNQAEGRIVKVGPKDNPKFYCVECGEPVTYIPDVPKTEGIFHGAQATLISNSDNRITTNNYYGGMPDEQVETPYGTCLKRDTRFCKQCRQWIPLTFYNAERGMCDNCIELQGAKAFEEGKTFLENGLYDEALSEFLKFEPICKEAKVLAELQYNIGYCFYKQEQWKDAFKYFIKSSDLVPDSLYYMALCFYYGYGITKSKERAYDLLKKANLHGSPKALEFMEGIPLFPVKRDGKVGYIDDEGYLVIACRWETDYYRRFSEGLIAVKDENARWGFINKLGQLVISCKWQKAFGFYEGLAAVQNESEKWGYINNCGKIIIPCNWDIVDDFCEGLARVEIHEDYVNDRLGFINKMGEIVIPYNWKAYWKAFGVGPVYSRFSEGLARVVDENERYGYIDKYGHVVIPCKWKNASDFSEGLAKVTEDHFLWGFIDKTGQIVIPYKWREADDFSEGLSAVRDEHLNWGYIDKTGKVVLPWEEKHYHSAGIGQFHEGLAAVCEEYSKGDRCGFIDKTGKVVIPYKWKKPILLFQYRFQKGLATVKDENGKEYYINKKGTIIAETGF